MIHITQCPYYAPVQTTFADIWDNLGWPSPAPAFGPALVYGHMPGAQQERTAQALQGAMLSATRWARVTCTTVRDDGTYLVVHSAAISSALRKWLRHNIALDLRAATAEYRSLSAAPAHHTWVRTTSMDEFHQPAHTMTD